MGGVKEASWGEALTGILVGLMGPRKRRGAGTHITPTHKHMHTQGEEGRNWGSPTVVAEKVRPKNPEMHSETKAGPLTPEGDSIRPCPAHPPPRGAPGPPGTPVSLRPQLTCVSSSVTSRLSLFKCLFTKVTRDWGSRGTGEGLGSGQ